MIKVHAHGIIIATKNPTTEQETVTQKVTFIEEGRSGANTSMDETTKFLNGLTGGNTGLNTTRTHTHTIRVEEIEKYPIGKTFNGFINRKMFSFPQMRQQSDRRAQMVDGKPTFFTTYISGQQEQDVDLRDSNSIVASVRPDLLAGAIVAKAEVRVVEEAQKEEIGEPVTAGQKDLVGG